jgi:hypothetical protein
VPLEEIAELLHDAAGSRRVLDRHRRRLESRLAELDALLASLARLEREETMTYDVRTKEVAPQQIIGVRIRTRLADIGTEAGQAYGELFAHLGRSGAAPAGPPLALYHGAPSDETRWRWSSASR